MRATLLTIGDEILIGQITNTNAVWMAQQLNSIGITVYEMLSVSDNAEHIKTAFDHALAKSDIVLVTGGLGPTKDDITKTTLADYFKANLVFDPQIWADIESYLTRRGHPILEAAKVMALIPDCCQALPNKHGLAPAMWFERDKGKVLIAMPGVPQEMMKFMELDVLPRLQTQFQLPVIVHHTIMTAGIAESSLAQKIEDIEDSLPAHIKLAYLPAYGVVRLRLSGSGNNRKAIEQEIAQYAQAIYDRLYPKYAFGTDNDTLESVLGELLVAQNANLALAESCTGGFIAHKITSVPGSSRYFEGSVVTYSYDLKQQLLGVKPETLAQYGAVSEQTVCEMAQGTIQNLHVAYAIAVSGIAGPGGATPDKPVGTVWIAVANRETVKAKRFEFARTRDINIQMSSNIALNELRKFIMGI
jgi:nicotinamide-nucleotide amidase